MFVQVVGCEEMTCGVLLVGMGCRASKHNNSVGDDNSNADTHADNYQGNK